MRPGGGSQGRLLAACQGSLVDLECVIFFHCFDLECVIFFHCFELGNIHAQVH